MINVALKSLLTAIIMIGTIFIIFARTEIDFQRKSNSFYMIFFSEFFLNFQIIFSLNRSVDMMPMSLHLLLYIFISFFAYLGCVDEIIIIKKL